VRVPEPVQQLASNRHYQILDLYWRLPGSGGLWYKSGQLKLTICSRSEGWWERVDERAATIRGRGVDRGKRLLRVDPSAKGDAPCRVQI